MHRILFSLVSYFVCLLFFVEVSQAATFTVTSSADNGVGSFRDIIVNQLPAAGAGPHTVNFAAGISSISIDYGAFTLATSNVTITGRFVGCDPDITITSPNDYYGFSITGSNVRIEGIKWRIRVNFIGGSNNKIYGCWFNLDDAGTAVSGHTNTASLVIGNCANMTVGATSDCKLRNVFSTGANSPNALAHSIFAYGNCNGLSIAGNYVGTDKTGSLTLANNTQNGILISAKDDQGNDVTTTINNSRIDSNTVIGSTTNGIYVQGTANNLLFRRNYLGAKANGTNGGATDLGNKKAGFRFEANTSAITISNNIVIDNGNFGQFADNSGIYLYSSSPSIIMSNITITNNKVGVDIAENKKGNDFAGIYLEGSPGANSMNTITISGNTCGDNGISNYLSSPSQKSHGIACANLGPSNVNLQITNNLIGVTSTFANVGNYGNGIEVNNVSGFSIIGNEVGFNKFATTMPSWTGGGIMVNSGSSTGIIRGNYIGESSTGVAIPNTNPGNASYPNQMAGITVQASSGITIGGTSAGQPNIIKNNNWGIQLVNSGATLATAVNILGNTISNQLAYGIYIIGGSTNTIGNGTAAGANIISTNGLSGTYDGIYILNTTSLNNKISRNQIFCNTGQGIKLNYGASQGNNGQAPPVITSISGNTVSGTATAGATVEIFVDDPACQIACGSATSDNRREGKTYLATVTATGGNWTYTSGSAIDANNISATATVGSNTSEFSTCNLLTICPITQITTSGPISICSTTTTVNLSALDQSSMAGVTQGWSSSNAGVTFSPSASSNAVTVGSLPIGTTTFTWLVQKAGCADDPKTINVTVNAAVTATATVSATACQGTSFSLTGNTPSAGTGLWTSSPTTGVTITNPTSPTTATAVVSSGTSVTFTWTVTNGACSAFSSKTVTLSTPVTATATVSATACQGTSFSLTGNTPSAGTGLWTSSPTTGVTITNPTSPTTATAVVSSGTSVTFTWTVTNGACSASDSKTVTLSTAVTATATVPATACQGTSFSLTGNTPSAGTGLWTSSPTTGVTITNPTSPTTATAVVSSGTSVTFTWTVTNGACSAFSSKTVTLSTPVTATATVSATACQGTSFSLTGNTPSAGTGLWTSSPTTGVTITNPTSPTTATAVVSSGTSVTFTWTVTNGACSASDSKTVTLSTAVTATATVPATACQGTSFSLTGNTPSAGTGLWTSSPTTGVTITNPTSPTTATAVVSSGTSVTFTWTVTNGACSAFSSKTVTLSTPVTATATVSATACQGTSFSLTGNTPSAGTGLWTSSPTTGVTITNPTSPTTATAVVSSGTSVTFTWTVTNGACSASDSKTVTLSTAVTATATVPAAACQGTSFSLTGNTPSAGTGLWTSSPTTGVTITNPTSPTTATAVVSSVTSVTFTWTVTNGACSAFDSKTVTVSTPVTPSANATANVCSSSPLVVLTGNPVNSPATGAWTVTGGTVTFGNASNASTTATITSGTSLTFTWKTTNGACITSANATTTVSSPVTATATSNVNAVCNSNPVVTLTGSNPNPGTGVWTVTGGTATYDNASNNVAIATIASGTSLTFTWTITNGACSTSASTNIITVSNPVNPVNATATSNVCSSSPVVFLGGSNPSPGTGAWTVVTGGSATFVDATQESTSATVTSGTSLTFKWTVTNGPCVTSATATTTVDAAVTADAGPAQALCNTTTTSLQGNTPSVGSGVWSVPTGSASVTALSNPTSGVTGLTIGGSSTLLWKVTNGACSATSSVTITVSAPGSISAGLDQSVCQTNAGTVTLVGTGSGTWSTISGSGIASSPGSSSTGVTGLTVGATSSFKWTVTSGACSGADTVNVTVDALPVGSAGSNQALCNQTVATLSATGSGGWTTLSGTGVVTSPSTGNSGVTGLTVGGSSTFRWTLTNGACLVPADVTVTSSSPVTANGGADVQVCNATVASLSATGTGAWTAAATMGTGTVSTPSNPSSGVTGLTVGATSVFQWIVTSGACADTNLVHVTSYSPATASAGIDKSLCAQTTYTMTATGTGSWLTAATIGTGTVTTPTSPTSGVTGLTIGGTSVFIWKVTNGTCSATDSVTISVSPGTTADAGSNQTLCNTTTTSLTAVGGTNGTWLTSTDATIDNLTDPHSSVTVINSPATLTWQIDGGGCGNATATVTLTSVTLAKPILDGTGLSQACSGSTYAYSINNIDASGSYNWSSNPSAGINITPSTGTSVSVSATSSGKLIVFVDKAGCSDSASAVIKVLPGPPSGGGTFNLATCVYTNYKIKSPLFDGFSGAWSSLSGSITFTFNAADSTTTIGGLVDGVNDTLTYHVSNTCGSFDYIFNIKAGGYFTALEASGPSDTLCVSQARNLNALVTPAGNYTYYWVSNVNYTTPVIDASVHIDSTTVPTYSVTPNGPNNVYFVYVLDKASQCRTNIDTAYIHAVEGQDLNVPNLITPNEDNMNDHWVLKDKTTGKDILPGSHFELYNRWGQRVFVMDNYDNRFKGDHISDGVYFFNVKSGCGTKEYKGWLQILGNTNP